MINVQVISPSTWNVLHLVSPFSYSLSSLPISVFTSSSANAFFHLSVFFGLGREMSENKLCFDFFYFVFLNTAFSKVFRNQMYVAAFYFLFYLQWFPSIHSPALGYPLMGSLCFFIHKVNTFFIFFVWIIHSCFIKKSLGFGSSGIGEIQPLSIPHFGCFLVRIVIANKKSFSFLRLLYPN